MKIRSISFVKHSAPVFALLLLCVMVCGSNAALAQQGQTYSASDLEQMVAPIALYPDDLLANVLTAATVPDQVSKAAAYLAQKGGKVTAMPNTDWDPAVKSLLFFPDVLNMMNSNSQWTQALGYAVSVQRSDVMNAIQVYRNTAYQAGNLRTTPEQTVAVSGNVVEIAPANPTVVYVPQYDPYQTMYPYSGVGPLISFGLGFLVGDWFGYRSFDWYHGNVLINPYNYRYFNYRRGQRYYNYANWQNRGYGGANIWRPGFAGMPVRPAYAGVPRITTPIARRPVGPAVRTPGIPIARPPVAGRPGVAGRPPITTARPPVTGRPPITTARPPITTARPPVAARPPIAARPPMPNVRPSTGTFTRPSTGTFTRPQVSRPSTSAFSNYSSGRSAISSSSRGSFSRGSFSRGGGISRGGGFRGGRR